MNKKNELLKLIEISDKLEAKKIEYQEQLEYIKDQAEKEQEHFKTGYHKILHMMNPNQKHGEESALGGDRSAKKSASYDLRFKESTTPGDPDATDRNSGTGKKKKQNALKTSGMKSNIKDGKLIPGSMTMDKSVLEVSTAQENHAETFESYVNFFDKIFQETQMNDIDEVIRTYHESEDHNENLYEEVTGLGNEVFSGW